MQNDTKSFDKEDKGQFKGGRNKRNNYKGKKGSKNGQQNKGSSNNRSSSGNSGFSSGASLFNTDQLMIDAARTSFYNPLGTPIHNVFDQSVFNNAVPGICGLYYVPTPGAIFDVNSAVNVSAKKTLAYIRSTLSTNITFAAPDLMMYFLAMDSILSAYSYCVRLIGLQNMYSSMNRYYPKELFNAMGIAIDSTTDWTNFRVWLNRFAYRASQLYVPANISLCIRHMWMNSSIYVDSPNAKAQTYIFIPRYLYKWDPDTDTHGTRLIPVRVPSAQEPSTLTGWAALEDIQDYCDDLLDALLLDVNDVSDISGLILRAFGADKCISLNTITEDFRIAPTFDPTILEQINNATICGEFDPATSGTITQNEFDAMSVEYKTFCPADWSLRHMEKDVILNSFNENPTSDEVFVATRFTARGDVDTTTETNALLQEFGTEFIEFAKIFSINSAGVGVAVISSSITEFAGCLETLAATSCFSNFPMLFSAVKTASGTPDKITGIITDIMNYTQISPRDLGRIHESAQISLFKSPTD